MPQGIYIDTDRSLSVRTYADPPLSADQVRVRTTWAAIKHGSLFTLYSGKSPFEGREFDLSARMFRPAAGTPRAVNPMAGDFMGMGTMVVGTVEARGEAVGDVAVGDLVYGHGPICETVTGRWWRRLGGLRPEDALCLDPATFAFGGVRDGRVQLGDRVAVFGLGAIGLLAVQLARMAGATVVAIDPVARRRALAERFGAALTIDPTAEDAAERIRAWAGSGVDVAIEVSGSYRALRDAIRACRQAGTVVMVSYYAGTPDHLDLGAEFFHNRLQLVASLPAWGNPDRDHPRWDDARVQDRLRGWFEGGAITSDGILDIVGLDQVPAAFLAAYRDPTTAVKLTVRFGSGATP